MPYLALPQAKLFYLERGRGRPSVAFVHGWTCDSEDWRWQIPEFAKHHRVIAADLRGHGRSAPSADTYQPSAMAADWIALLTYLVVDQAVIVGHSLGAAVAAIVAVERPDLISALVAAEPAYGIDNEGAAEALALIATLRQSPRADPIVEFVQHLEGGSTPTRLREWHRRRAAKMNPSIALRSLADLWEPEDQISLEPATTQYLSRLTRPVLEVHSDHARSAQKETESRNRQRVIWDGAGHWLHQERPKEFNSLVLDWIRSHT